MVCCKIISSIRKTYADNSPPQKKTVEILVIYLFLTFIIIKNIKYINNSDNMYKENNSSLSFSLETIKIIVPSLSDQICIQVSRFKS